MLIVFGPVWFLSKIDNYERSVRESRYSSQAISSLALRANLRFPSRIKEYSPDNKRRYWHQDDVPCMQTTRKIITGPNGRKSTSSWPSGDIPDCDDFNLLKKGDVDERGFERSFCSPVLAAKNFPISNGYDYSLVSVDQPAGTSWPELVTGALSVADKDYVLQQQLSRLDHPSEANFIRKGGFNSVVLKPTGIEKCNGFEIRRFEVKILNMDRLELAIPVGLK